MENNARNFEEDLELSNKSELKKAWEQIFKKEFGPNIIICWKNDPISQKDFGTDILITTEKGRKYAIDIKTKNHKYLTTKKWPLEIVHHRYTDKTKTKKIETTPGWLYKSVADLIFFGTLNKDNNQIIETCGFSLIPFKDEEFKHNITTLEKKWATTQFKKGTFQLTIFKLANLEFLKKYAHKFFYSKKKRIEVV